MAGGQSQRTLARGRKAGTSRGASPDWIRHGGSLDRVSRLRNSMRYSPADFTPRERVRLRFMVLFCRITYVYRHSFAKIEASIFYAIIGNRSRLALGLDFV